MPYGPVHPIFDAGIELTLGHRDDHPHRVAGTRLEVAHEALDTGREVRGAGDSRNGDGREEFVKPS